MIGLFIALWVVLALVSPTRTLHLAPVIVGAWPLFGSVIDNKSLSRLDRIKLSGVGLMLGIATTTVLALAGGLEGPSLLPIGGAALEGYLFALLGAIAALAIAPIWREQSLPSSADVRTKDPDRIA